MRARAKNPEKEIPRRFGLSESLSAKQKKARRSANIARTAGLVRRLVWENLRKHRKATATAVLCMFVVAASTAYIAWLMRWMVNSLFVEGDRQAIWAVSAAVVAVFFARGIAAYFQATIMGSVGASILADLQKRQFEKLMSQDVAHYVGVHPAKYVAKMLHAARAARNVIDLVLTNFFRDAFTLLGLLVVMILQDPIMSGVALLGSPFVVFGISRIVRKTREFAKQEEHIISNVTASASEAIQGVRIVKSFHLEDEMNRRVSSDIDRMEERQKRINNVVSATSPMMDIFAGLIIGSFIAYTSWQTLVNGKTPGEFMAFIAAFLLAYEPAKRLANFQVQLQRRMVAVERMYRLLDAPDPEVRMISCGTFRATAGHIRFQDVRFEYKSSSPVLHGVSFEVPSRQKVALVGRSGAGKSTVFDLILGIYRNYSGSITIDGFDIGGADLADLRASIAYVAQNTFLFTGTVRDNIRFGRPDANEQEIIEAAKAAYAWNFIEALPKGLDTLIGPDGSTLSGGERQRIAIARALIKNAPILLLDEATSALDGESERAVRNAESHLLNGRTTIVIAHRLSTIKDADKIVVLDGGKVLAQGSHEELARSNATYRALFASGEFVDDKAVGQHRPVPVLT